jgi:hypothetical protein
MRLPPDGFLTRRTCLCCEREWGSDGRGSFYTWEHGIPEILGGRLESRLFCHDCNSRFGGKVDHTVLQPGLLQLAAFDLRSSSRVAARFYSRVASRLSRCPGGRRNAGHHYRTVTAPQYVARVPDPTTRSTRGAAFEAQHLYHWWRAEAQRRRSEHIVVAGEAEFLQAAHALKKNVSGLALPIPGGGWIQYDTNGVIVHEFPPTVPWPPVVKIAITTLCMFRNDLQLDVVTQTGLVSAGEILRRIRDQDPTLQNPLHGAPAWRTPGPQVDVRFVLEHERVLRIGVYLFGFPCGTLAVRARESAHELDEFVHYTGGIDTGEERLFPSKQDYVDRRSVRLDSDETVRSFLADLRNGAIPWREVPPSAP